jgi:hypothetical protein
MDDEVTFSYEEPGYQEYLLGDARVRVEKYSRNIARVYFVSKKGEETPAPEDAKMEHDEGVGGAKARYGPYDGYFLITFFSHYTLYLGEQAVLDFRPKRQHCIRKLIGPEKCVGSMTSCAPRWSQDDDLELAIFAPEQEKAKEWREQEPWTSRLRSGKRLNS